MIRLFAAVASAVLLATSACGGGGEDTASAARTVEVDMIDNAFEPATLTVADGEEITFVFRNRGTVAHEAALGAGDARNDHGHHADSDAVEVAPGKTARLTHTFERGDTVEVACHMPGHYESGMKLTIAVT